MKSKIEVSNLWQDWCKSQSEITGVDFSNLKDVIAKEVQWFGSNYILEGLLQARLSKSKRIFDKIVEADPWIEWRLKFLEWILE